MNSLFAHADGGEEGGEGIFWLGVEEVLEMGSSVEDDKVVLGSEVLLDDGRLVEVSLVGGEIGVVDVIATL